MDNEENSGAFYRIPKYLFGEKYKNILSTDAKLLYALLLDRASLSAHNGWFAEDGRVFLYFTVAEAMNKLSFGKNKIIRLFDELEKTDLIDRVKTGLGKASIIYFSKEVSKRDFSKFENETSGSLENKLQEVSNSNRNNTEYNNNYFNKTEPTTKGEWTEVLRENVEYDIMIHYRPQEKLDTLISIAAETLCGYAGTYRINNADVPYEAVKEKFLTLNEDHIIYAVDVLDEVKWNVKNMRSYILTVLYNAPDTIDAYYQAMVNRDLGIA